MLETSRLWLRPLTSSDVEPFWQLCNEPLVRRFLWDDQPVAREVIEAIVTAHAAQVQRGQYGLLAVTRQPTAEFIGFCGLRDADEGRIEVLYGLAPSQWGQGLATEAARAILAHAVTTWGLSTLYASVDSGNHDSIRVLRKLGMTPDLPPHPADAADLLRFVLRSDGTDSQQSVSA
jgi:[ribosomal protein S5]-alanine N-acetyltransferase